MYRRLEEIERQHNDTFKTNPYGATIHPRDTDWLIEQAKRTEQLEKENELLRKRLAEICPHNHFEDGLYMSNPPKKRCLECGEYVTV